MNASRWKKYVYVLTKMLKEHIKEDNEGDKDEEYKAVYTTASVGGGGQGQWCKLKSLTDLKTPKK